MSNYHCETTEEFEHYIFHWSKLSVPAMELSNFDFAEFDPKLLFNSIYQVFHASKIFDFNQISEMLLKTVEIGLLRGNIRSDQLQKFYPEKKKEIEQIISFWNFVVAKDREENVLLTDTSLSFSRFLAIVPNFASYKLVKERAKFERNFPGFGVDRFPVQSRRLPVAMLHCGFAGLIPRDVDIVVEKYVNLLLACHIGYMVEFGRVIDPANNESFGVSVEKQRKYVERVRNGQIREVDRIGYCFAFGLEHRDSIRVMVEVGNDVLIQEGKSADFGVEMFTYDADGFAEVIPDDDLMKKVVDGGKEWGRVI